MKKTLIQALLFIVVFFITFGVQPAHSCTASPWDAQYVVGDQNPNLIPYDEATQTYILDTTFWFTMSNGTATDFIIAGNITATLTPNSSIKYDIFVHKIMNGREDVVTVPFRFMMPLNPPVDYPTYVRASLKESDEEDFLFVKQTSDVSDDNLVWTDLNLMIMYSGLVTEEHVGPFLGPEGTWYALGTTLNIFVPMTGGIKEYVDIDIQGETRMDPVPIPPSVLLFGSGLFGLVAFGYRRKK